jgi:hypothetical protein
MAKNKNGVVCCVDSIAAGKSYRQLQDLIANCTHITLTWPEVDKLQAELAEEKKQRKCASEFNLGVSELNIELQAENKQQAEQIAKLQDGITLETQNRIQSLLMKECELETEPDGTGCESGDPVDVTLAEISIAIGQLKDKQAEQIKRLKCDNDCLRQYLCECNLTDAYSKWLEMQRLINEYIKSATPQKGKLTCEQCGKKLPPLEKDELPPCPTGYLCRKCFGLPKAATSAGV